MKYNIVLAPDENYVEHSMATITSILENTNNPEDIIFNIIDADLNDFNKEQLENLNKKYGSMVKFIKIKEYLLENVFVDRHITKASYYRILSSESLDKEIETFLYLDCDLIVRTNIKELFAYDLNDYYLGAVGNKDFNDEVIKHLKLPKGTAYFNAGVLLINKNKWDRDNISEKIIQYINNNPNKLINHDQDALNAILYNKWLELPVKWNLRTPILNYDYRLAGVKNEEDLKELLENPYLVHFTTSLKPWHFFSEHPFKQEYYYYLNKSDYPNKRKSKIYEISKRTTYLFGASIKGKEVLDLMIKHNLNIVGYLDNSKQKWNTKFENKMIYNPNDLRELLFDSVIIIASQFEDEIANQLNGYGLIENKHYFRLQKYLSL